MFRKLFAAVYVTVIGVVMISAQLPEVRLLTNGQKYKIQGIIVKNDDSVIIIRDDKGFDFRVVVRPNTSIKLSGSKGNLPASDLPRGLRAKIEGRGDSSGSLEAVKISFNKDEYQTAKSLDVRVTPVIQRYENAPTPPRPRSPNEERAGGRDNTQVIAALRDALGTHRLSGSRHDESRTLLELGDAYLSSGDVARANESYRSSMTIRKELGDAKGEIESTMRLADGLQSLFKADESIDLYKSVVERADNTSEPSVRAEAYMRMGQAYQTLARYDEGEAALKRALQLYLEIGPKSSYATALTHLAALYFSKASITQSRTTYERALTLFKETGNDKSQAYVLLALADISSYSNEHDRAMESVLQAKPIFDKQNDKYGKYAVEKTLGWLYLSASKFDESIKAGKAAVALAEVMKDADRKGDALLRLASTYSAVAQYDISLKLYGDSLEIARKTGNFYSEAVALGNIGYDYLLQAQFDKARQYLDEALALMRARKLHREEGYTLHNLGLVHHGQRDYPKSLELYHQALVIYRDVGDRRPETFLYDSIGETYREMGRYEIAESNLQKALISAREIEYKEVEASALANLMLLYRKTSQPRLAILYGKQAVNVRQNIRTSNRNLDRSAMKSYLQSNAKTYRELADLMVEQGRLPEAQQVLDLLKEEEFFEFVRRDASEAADQAKLSLNPLEKKALEDYTRASDVLTSLGTRFQELQEKRAGTEGKLIAAEEAELLDLKNQIESAGEGLRAFLSKLAVEFSKTVEDGAVITPRSIDTLRADLRRAGRDVVLVSTYMLPDRYRVIVTTGRTMVDRKVEYRDLKLSSADVNRKIAAFKSTLENPRVDPRPLGKELYDIFVKPLERDLRSAGAKTVLWSLDGSLRYIPIAALSPDGKTYLAEHFQNVVVTLARQTNLFSKPSGDEWRAIGAGVSKQHAGFSSLPSVPREINSIVRGDDSTGVLDGTKLLDEKFDLETFRSTILQKSPDGRPFNVVHLATHFSLGATNENSALLLGDGKRLSLYEIGKDEELDFKDVELLTLSACETGIGTENGTGREVESLGMVAQQKGAKAVMATLWKVADDSTALFMSEFYRLKKHSGGMSKAEAVRQVQIAFIKGRIKSTGTLSGCRSDPISLDLDEPAKFRCDAAAPYSHPYFWSPFVLIGNWR